MKKISFFLLLALILISCDSESIESSQEITDEQLNQLPSVDYNKEMFLFDNWDDFFSTYNKFSKMSIEELESNSFYSNKSENSLSPAIQGILDENNEFKVEGKLVRFIKGDLYEVSDKLKKIGSISNEFIEQKENNNKVIMNENGDTHSNQYRFRKQRYVENCGSGKVQGPSPRDFKYVNELFSERVFIYGPFVSQYHYSLYLRVKLEYNHRRRSWRASGERREITISVNDNSRLANGYGGYFYDQSGHPASYQINRTLSCASDQVIALRTFHSVAPINSGAYWDARMLGTITQKMYGDVESNRWVNYISW